MQENAWGVSPLTLNFIKKLEGYTPRPKWDFKQFSTGYGTRWQPGQPIGTKADHEAALAREAGAVNSWLDQNVKSPMTENQRAALISAGFNLGTGEKGLGRLLGDLNAGNWDSIASRLPSFNKAGGQVNEGLVNRRAQEVAMLTGQAPSDANMNRNPNVDPRNPHSAAFQHQMMGGTGAPTGGPMPMAIPSAPTGRYSKLADALMARAASAQPKGWGDALNALGSAYLGYSLADKNDTAEKAYRSKLSEALMGAKDNDALVNTMLSSGDPDLQSAAVNLKVAQMKPKSPEIGRFKVENGAVIDTATGQIVSGALRSDNKPTTISPGQVLVDPASGREIYAAPDKESGPVTVSPGQRLVDPKTGIDLYAAPADNKPTAMSPGQVLVDTSSGREIYAAPDKESGPVTVSPGQRLVDPKTGIDLYAAPDKPEGLQTVAPGATLYDPNTKQTVFTATPKAGDFKEGQTKAANFGKMMTEAEKLVGDQPNPLGFWEQLREGVSPEIIANQMRSPEYQKYRQAADQWIRAKLRKESGATITPEESEDEFRTFFPQPGDNPAVVAQKKAARQQAIQGMIAESGGAYDQLFQGQTPAPSTLAAPAPGPQGAVPASTPMSAPRPQGISDEQIMQEATKAMREGKDPAAVRQQLEAWGIRF